MNIRKVCAAVLATVMVASTLAGCGKTEKTNGESTGGKKDVVKIWTFPVEKDYKKNFQAIKEDFESKNKNIIPCMSLFIVYLFFKGC